MSKIISKLSADELNELIDSVGGLAQSVVGDKLEIDGSGISGGFVPVITDPERNDILQYIQGSWINRQRYNSQVIVKSLADLPTPIGNEIFLLDLIYTIDGDLDISGYTLCFGAKTQVNGIGQNVSIIRSSTSGTVGNPYVFFESSANLFMNDLEIVCEGTNQLVWKHIGTGIVPEGESFELNRFNLVSFPPGGGGHNNQLGFIKDIRQGFIGTFSCFGFENGFICAGSWDGGFRVDNTLFRVFSGVAFGSDPLDPVSFQLRMSSNANLSIPLGSIGYDFPSTAFNFTGQYQLQNGNVSGDGLYVSDFASGFPAFDPIGNFQNNTGIQNTFQGGEWVSNANTDTILTQNVWTALNVTTDNKFLTWFSELNGIFTYDGGTPLDVTIFLTLSMTGKANDIIEVRLMKETALGVITEILRRQITIQGSTAQGRAESVPIQSTQLIEKDDTIYVEVRNTSGNTNITTLLNSNCIIGAK